MKCNTKLTPAFGFRCIWDHSERSLRACLPWNSSGKVCCNTILAKQKPMRMLCVSLSSLIKGLLVSPRSGNCHWLDRYWSLVGMRWTLSFSFLALFFKPDYFYEKTISFSNVILYMCTCNENIRITCFRVLSIFLKTNLDLFRILIGIFKVI